MSAFMLQWQNLVVAKTIWLAKSNILTTYPFPELVCQP